MSSTAIEDWSRRRRTTRPKCILLGLLLLAVAQIAQIACAEVAEQLCDATLAAHRAARDAIKAAWTPDIDLICATPRVWGPMDKLANGSSIASLHNNMNGKAWARYHTESVPIYASPSIIVSHKFRFIYLWQPKTSSSLIMAAMNETFCDKSCTAYELTQTYPQAIDDDTWTKYFVFTWIRNPWKRMASIYRMLTHTFLHKRLRAEGCNDREDAVECVGAVGPKCALPFSHYTENTRYVLEECKERDCCPYMPALKTWNLQFIQPIINDQSITVFTADGLSRVDFIGRTEHMRDDWVELMQIIRDRSRDAFIPASIPASAQERGGSEHHISGQQFCENAADAGATMFNSTTLWNIAMQYALDVHRFGYMPVKPQPGAQSQ